MWENNKKVPLFQKANQLKDLAEFINRIYSMFVFMFLNQK